MAYITVDLLNEFAKKFAKKCTNIFAKKTEIPESLPANGGDATTVNGHTVETNVPADAKFTDTVYKSMTGASDTAAGKTGLVPAPAAGKQDAYLRGDGTWQELQEATTADIDAIIAGAFEEE